MARYYFHASDGATLADEEGLECSDLEAAMHNAVREARVLAADSVREKGILDPTHRIDVADADGTIVYSVRVGDVVTVSGPAAATGAPPAPRGPRAG